MSLSRAIAQPLIATVQQHRAFQTSTLSRRQDDETTKLTSLPNSLPLYAHPNSTTPTQLPDSSSSVLSLIASQPSHYITALLLGRRYQLTPNDVLTVPHMKGVKPGDRIELTRILEVGSRDYTLRAMPDSNSPTASSSSNSSLKLTNANEQIQVNGPLLARLVVRQGVPRDWQRHPDSLPWLKQDQVKCHVTVLEHTKGKMFTVDKFKRRKGYRRTLRSKLEFTKLRVGHIEIGSAAST
ncbi:hypothetical protein OIO90_003031 [Microbotryomycetes sp. JL221]|nr:hypothetical protein OIO90_003031 [Microbotryomycetes sp. JL221]